MSSLVAVVASATVTLLPAFGCSKTPQPAQGADRTAAGHPQALILPATQRERINIVEVQRTTYRPVVQATGTVAFDGDISTAVLAPISGPITRIVVQPGTWVKQNALLASVSSPDFADAVSAYRKAAATARNAQHVADLDEQLFQNDGIARRDLEQAQTDAVAANADRDAALQQLRALGVDAETIDALQNNRPVRATEGAIRAPIEGEVVERLCSPGQLIQAGSTQCFTVADVSKMWVMAHVFESDVGAVQKGDHADVTTGASAQVFHGSVDNIAALVDPDTKATEVRIVVPNTGRLLKKDMYVNTAIHSRIERTGLLAPVSAVLRDDDNQPFVFIQTSSGTYERRSVQLGSRVGDQYEMLKGLSPGEHVVAQGGLFLQFVESQ